MELLKNVKAQNTTVHVVKKEDAEPAQDKADVVEGKKPAKKK